MMANCIFTSNSTSARAAASCSLTYGLPQVFERHPIINLKGLVSDIASRAGWELDDVWWRIGTTESLSSALHRIPLVLIQNKGK